MDYSWDEKILKNFGRNLKKARLRKKLSLRQLADVAELNFGNIGDIELGKVNPGITTLIRLAAALEVDPCDLLVGVK